MVVLGTFLFGCDKKEGVELHSEIWENMGVRNMGEMGVWVEKSNKIHKKSTDRRSGAGGCDLYIGSSALSIT